jgi:hypothetical protein
MRCLRVFGGKAVITLFLSVLQITCWLIGLPTLSIILLLFVEFILISSVRYIDLALIRFLFPTFQVNCWLIAFLGRLGTARGKTSTRAFPLFPDPNVRMSFSICFCMM